MAVQGLKVDCVVDVLGPRVEPGRCPKKTEQRTYSSSSATFCDQAASVPRPVIMFRADMQKERAMEAVRDDSEGREYMRESFKSDILDEERNK